MLRRFLEPGDFQEVRLFQGEELRGLLFWHRHSVFLERPAQFRVDQAQQLALLEGEFNGFFLESFQKAFRLCGMDLPDQPQLARGKAEAVDDVVFLLRDRLGRRARFEFRHTIAGQ